MQLERGTTFVQLGQTALLIVFVRLRAAHCLLASYQPAITMIRCQQERRFFFSVLFGTSLGKINASLKSREQSNMVFLSRYSRFMKMMVHHLSIAGPMHDFYRCS